MCRDAENPMVIDNLWRDLDEIDAEDRQEKDDVWAALADLAFDAKIDFE